MSWPGLFWNGCSEITSRAQCIFNVFQKDHFTANHVSLHGFWSEKNERYSTENPIGFQIEQTSCVTLEKLPNLSDSQFAHMRKGKYFPYKAVKRMT